MSYEKEIIELHKKGFVILSASRSTNAPIGWKRTGSDKRGYTEEMADPTLAVYKRTFNAKLLAHAHCGFYLGHNGLCCIDLDTKKVTIEQTTKLKDEIVKALGTKVAVERTKSNGFHIYFRYKQSNNVPDWTGSGAKNWIEVYYTKRFIACYLSNSKKYTLEHGTINGLSKLTDKDHSKLLAVLEPYKAKQTKKKSKVQKISPTDAETWDEAENYVKQLEEKKLDITGDNPTWFKIGKSFASAFGAKGFEMFNRLSQFSPTYNADTIQDVYERFVEDDTKHHNKKITIATFFKLCQDAELTDLRTAQTLNMQPVAAKEFELAIFKNDSMAEKCHTVVTEFLKQVHLCCIDSASFYIYLHTHWIKCNARFVTDLITDFISRSDVNPKYIKTLQTITYLEMMLRELRLVTLRDALEPRMGNLKEGIFINLENGVLHINMQTGKRKLLDHDPSYNFTTILPFCYEAGSACPRFDAWLNTQVPDKDLHTAYYAFVASCLTGHKADIIMLLVGDTSTGKSSLIDITRRVIGLDNSVAISASTLFGGTSEAAAVAMQMENKLLAYDFDSEPFKHPEMLLKVAMQEPIMGWQMHVARRQVINYGRLIIAMNVYNYSVFNTAIARRFITVNMDVTVTKDNSVMPAIYENELAGIFNKVLNVGLKHLIDNDGQIARTARMHQATVQFHMRNRDTYRFLEYNGYVALTMPDNKTTKISMYDKIRSINDNVDSIEQVSLGELYSAFRVWMEDVEGYPIGKILLRKHFVEDLKKLGIIEVIYRDKEVIKRGIWLGKLVTQKL